MSLILDALNRSRQDTESVPGLASEHFIEEPSPARRFGPWIALLLVMLLIAWFLPGGEQLSDSGQDNVVPDPAPTRHAPQAHRAADAATSAPTQPAPSMTPPVPAAPAPQMKASPQSSQQVKATQPAAAAPAAVRPAAPEPAPASGRPPAAQSGGPDRAALEALYEQSRKAAANKTAASNKAKQTVANRKTREAGADTRAADKPIKAPATNDKPLDVDELLAMAQQEAQNVNLQEHPAPFLVRLSQQVKNDIPSIMYQRHEYSSTRGQSKVTLNGKSVGVGGSPAAGLRVDEILENSVVLTYRGTQFRLRALNSWVNL